MAKLKRKIINNENAPNARIALTRIVFKLVFIHVLVMATISQWIIIGHTSMSNYPAIIYYLSIITIFDIILCGFVGDGTMTEILLVLMRFFFYVYTVPIFRNKS